MKRSIFLRAAAAVCAVLLSGCSLLPAFRTPEEVRAAQEAAEASRAENQARVDPTAMEVTPLVFHRELINSRETVLAQYSVSLPQFDDTGVKSQSFQRINDRFHEELDALNADCDSFFRQTEESLGDGWDLLTVASDVASVTVAYTVLRAPAGYLCVRFDYEVHVNGQTDFYSKAAVFLLDNGWELDLPTLLGSDYEKVSGMLLDDIFDWCNENGVSVTGPESLRLSDLEDGYALTATAIWFYTKPFQLSNSDGTRYAVRIPLTDYFPYLTLQ
ncbi:MAG: hypothetical protein IJT76_06815 [Clostridia bacterium]|nr:hypothetical protein [Clostridia bacterium]